MRLKKILQKMPEDGVFLTIKKYHGIIEWTVTHQAIPMNLDLRSQYDNFVKMSFEQKRNAIIILLEGVKESNQLFMDLYGLIISDVAIEQDFFDIFDSLTIVLYREEKEDEKKAIDRLTQIRNTLKLQKQREDVDRLKWEKEAKSLLDKLL